MIRGMDGDPRPVTRLLARLRGGDPLAADELLALVHDELHALARSAMRRQGANHTLQPTALLNEAWIRMAGSGGELRDREHFLATAARTMRTVLVDHTRRRRAAKRDAGGERAPLEAVVLEWETDQLDLLALDEALAELETLGPELVHLVELRFFAGLTHPEIAAATGASLRRVERDWAFARDWLRTKLETD
jgi:RNA polymerase sigma factor (TIGR02999 family)